jgi:hypothetical protein
VVPGGRPVRLLQFAHDLLHRARSSTTGSREIIGTLPKKTDVLAQTYVYDHGKMYCRYAPGFPMLVASWIGSSATRASRS